MAGKQNDNENPPPPPDLTAVLVGLTSTLQGINTRLELLENRQPHPNPTPPTPREIKLPVQLSTLPGFSNSESEYAHWKENAENAFESLEDDDDADRRKYQLMLPSLSAEIHKLIKEATRLIRNCLLYTSPSPRDKRQSRMPSSA